MGTPIKLAFKVEATVGLNTLEPLTIYPFAVVIVFPIAFSQFPCPAFGFATVGFHLQIAPATNGNEIELMLKFATGEDQYT